VQVQRFRHFQQLVRGHALEIGQRVAGEIGRQLRLLVLLLRPIRTFAATFATFVAGTRAAVAIAVAETIAAMAVAILETAFVAALAAVTGFLAAAFGAGTLGAGTSAALRFLLGRGTIFRRSIALVAGLAGFGVAATGALARGRRGRPLHRRTRHYRRAFCRRTGARRAFDRSHWRTLGNGRNGGGRRGVSGFTAGFIRSTRLARTFLGKAAGFSFVVGHRVPRECE
jgi:hypothetical protein